jgi:hypothetical protein
MRGGEQRQALNSLATDFILRGTEPAQDRAKGRRRNFNAAQPDCETSRDPNANRRDRPLD